MTPTAAQEKKGGEHKSHPCPSLDSGSGRWGPPACPGEDVGAAAGRLPPGRGTSPRPGLGARRHRPSAGPGSPSLPAPQNLLGSWVFGPAKTPHNVPRGRQLQDPAPSSGGQRFQGPRAPGRELPGGLPLLLAPPYRLPTLRPSPRNSTTPSGSSCLSPLLNAALQPSTYARHSLPHSPRPSRRSFR